MVAAWRRWFVTPTLPGPGRRLSHSPHWHGTNHAIRSRRFHYIHYSDGGEELYDSANDPNQWKNLAGDPLFAKVKNELEGWLPTDSAEHFRSVEQ